MHWRPRRTIPHTGKSSSVSRPLMSTPPRRPSMPAAAASCKGPLQRRTRTPCRGLRQQRQRVGLLQSAGPVKMENPGRWPEKPVARVSTHHIGGRRGTRTPTLTRQNTGLPAVSFRVVPVQSRSLPADMFSGLDGVKSSHQVSGVHRARRGSPNRRPVVLSLSITPAGSGFPAQGETHIRGHVRGLRTPLRRPRVACWPRQGPGGVTITLCSVPTCCTPSGTPRTCRVPPAWPTAISLAAAPSLGPRRATRRRSRHVCTSAPSSPSAGPGPQAAASSAADCAADW